MSANELIHASRSRLNLTARARLDTTPAEAATPRTHPTRHNAPRGPLVDVDVFGLVKVQSSHRVRPGRGRNCQKKVGDVRRNWTDGESSEEEKGDEAIRKPV